jgi:aerobic-type carbon monoxide dehydrogenase small subunit (CoxS/CutS family)
MQVTITINGEAVSRDVEPRTLLVHFIRDTPGRTGAATPRTAARASCSWTARR